MAKRPKIPLSPYDPKFSGRNQKEPKMSKDDFSDFMNIQIPPMTDSIIRDMQDAILYGHSVSGFYSADFAAAASRPAAPDTSGVDAWLQPTRNDVTWTSVIGNHEAKQALRLAIEDATTHASLFSAYQMQPPKGVLLYGPPGCGKTMLAKAAATALRAEHYLLINGTELESKWYGETEKRIRDIFSYARSYAKHYKKQLLIFMDEADSFLMPRGTNHSINDGAVAQFLTELDGMQEFGAFLILARNRPDNIDEALLRDGRISRKIKICRPDYNGVADIIAQALAKVPLSCSHDLLVDTATELLFSPNFVLQDLAALGFKMSKTGELDVEHRALHFCLSDIVSGALATSVVDRAKTFAFQRDRKTGEVSGLSAADIKSAVEEIHRDNLGLQHHFALREFCETKKLELERKG